jgi:predicted O-methyltransferase YrrM
VSRIPNFFSFVGYYNEVAGDAPPGSTLVEVGVFCGASLIHLAKATREKGCRVVGVDWCRGSKEFEEHGEDVGRYWTETGKMAGELVRNLLQSGCDVPLVVDRSAAGAGYFADGSLWFVFLDADHSYESVKADIAAWWPKVAPGGRIAGHDYSTGRYPGVRQAADEFAAAVGLPLRDTGDSCWEVTKP